MADFSFLPLLSSIQPPQTITSQPSPPKHIPNPPPLITLEDYSVVHVLQDPPPEDNSGPSTIPESPLAKTLFSHSNYSASGDSDSEMFYPPSSGGPSEASSAMVSESDLPSAVASEADLPLQSNLHPVSKKQAGIRDFFRALTEDEVEAVQTKRKRTDSDVEADRAVRRQKEEQTKEKKLSRRREGNRLAQQKHRRKLAAIDIKTGVRDSDGKRIQVS